MRIPQQHQKWYSVQYKESRLRIFLLVHYIPMAVLLVQYKRCRVPIFAGGIRKIARRGKGLKIGAGNDDPAQ